MRRAPELVGTAKQNLKDQADAQIDRIKSLPELVRGTDKKEWAVRLPDVEATLSSAIRAQPDPFRCGACSTAQF